MFHLRLMAASLIVAVVAGLVSVPREALAGAGDYDVSLGERIFDFHSELVIHQDSTITVTETIRVQVLGDQINRGIYREFPTKYIDKLGRRRTVGFNVISVLRDGSPEAYHLKALRNGTRVYIGKEDYYLPWGTYEYEITYDTNRQLGFFDDHDELYWNVTGNDWDFTIDQASARVTLPADPGRLGMQLAAYTGYFGEQGELYEAQLDDQGRAVFTTTAPLYPQQGLTIVAMFPKGLVAEPTRRQLRGYWLADHRAEVWGAVGLAVVLLYYLLAWILVGVDPAGSPAPPQDTPPQGLSAAALRYIQRMGSDFTTFTAALTSMAIKGYLRIEADAGGSHTIVRGTAGEDELTEEEKELGREMFRGRHELLIDQDNHSIISSSKGAMDRALNSQCQGRLFYSNGRAIAWGVILTIVAFIMMAANVPEWPVLVICGAFTWLLTFFGLKALRTVVVGWGITVARSHPDSRALAAVVAPILLGLALVPAGIILFIYSLELAVLVIGLAVVNALFIPLLPRYTVQGRSILDHAAAFRLALAGYGRALPGYDSQDVQSAMAYLPYAIALDIQRQWARQLEEIFAVKGQPARPYWYHDPYNENIRYERLTSDLAGSFTTSISSASVAPGSSSGGGGGGGGFSGGGGGGGGGGGW